MSQFYWFMHVKNTPKNATMKRLFTILILISAGVFSINAMSHWQSSFCDGPVIKEKRKIGAFNRIEAGGIYDIVYKHSATVSCEIEAEENLVRLTRTRVVDGTLFIEASEGFSNSSEGIKVYLSGPDFQGATLSGAANLETHSGFTNERVEITMDGATNYYGALNTSELVMNMNGASNAELEGKATLMKLVLCGACQVDGKEIKTDVLKASLAGASTAYVSVQKTLDVSTTGASHLTYIGNPSSVTRSTNGSSSVDQENE